MKTKILKKIDIKSVKKIKMKKKNVLYINLSPNFLNFIENRGKKKHSPILVKS